MTDRLDIFSFYEEAEAGDAASLHFASGQTVGPAYINGLALGGGEVHVILTNGSRMRLREGDSAEIIHRARRSR